MKAFIKIAGLDEAGAGCLAGPVFAAAVILPDIPPKDHPLYKQIRDSKKLSPAKRKKLAKYIKDIAVSYGVAAVTVEEIDKKNILQSRILAMHKALDKLKVKPNKLLVDGDKFTPYQDIPHELITGGDDKEKCIGAASILAKFCRDTYVEDIMHPRYKHYNWKQNKGYGTKEHRDAILKYGVCPQHRNLFVRNISKWKNEKKSALDKDVAIGKYETPAAGNQKKRKMPERETLSNNKSCNPASKHIDKKQKT